MEIASISSGSHGNCILVMSEKAHILVDIGISKKKVLEGLEILGVNPNDIDAILVTHEHTDHIKGVGVFARCYNTPIYSTHDTIECIKDSSTVGDVNDEQFNEITPFTSFEIEDIEILPISTSHDAVDSVCYRFDSDDKSCAIVTDLGMYTEEIVDNLQGLNALFVESNHDLRMLETGPYPYHLKTRVWGKRGHLSNEDCGKLISEVAHDDLEHIVLCHLSKENNIPELAYESVRAEINSSEVDFSADDFSIKVTKREEVSCKIKI